MRLSPNTQTRIRYWEKRMKMLFINRRAIGRIPAMRLIDAVYDEITAGEFCSRRPHVRRRYRGGARRG